MSLGYSRELYMLAFDDRGSFNKNLLGIDGAPTSDQLARIADTKLVMFQAFEVAVADGVDSKTAGLLVDGQYGAEVVRRVAVGRTLCRGELVRYVAGEIDCDQAAAAIAGNYRRLVDAYGPRAA